MALIRKKTKQKCGFGCMLGRYKTKPESKVVISKDKPKKGGK